MKTPLIPWSEALRDLQQYQRTAWFVFHWMEREHRLNLDALAANWPWLLRESARAFESAARPRDER